VAGRVRGRPLLLGVACLLLEPGVAGWQPTRLPVEVGHVERLEVELERAEADRYAHGSVARHRQALDEARAVLAREELRFSLFRKYDRAAEHYRALLADGVQVLAEAGLRRRERVSAAAARIDAVRGRIGALREVTTLMNEGRLARRSLMQADTAVEDAQRALAVGSLEDAEAQLERAETRHRAAEKTLAPTVCRYLDSTQVGRWRILADRAIAESVRKHGPVLLVLKLERKLLVYRGGKVSASYPVGLGMNGLSDKLFRGDRATPEGRYTVLRKVPGSTYYKALLIDYPNQEDRRRFERAVTEGRVPAGRGIGGSVEIHGGGRNSITEGCVSLDNPAMEELFAAVDEGTPVFIVGTLGASSLLSTACPKRT